MKLFQLKVMTAVLTSLALSVSASTSVSKKTKSSASTKATAQALQKASSKTSQQASRQSTQKLQKDKKIQKTQKTAVTKVPVVNKTKLKSTPKSTTKIASNGSTGSSMSNSSSTETNEASTGGSVVSNSVAAKAAPETLKQEKKLNTLIEVSRSNSLYDKEDGSEQASWDFTFSTRYQWTKEYSTGLLLEGLNDIKDETQSDVTRLQLNLRRHGMDTKYVGFTGNFNWGLPVSKAQNLATLQSSVGLGFRGDLKPEVLFSDRLSPFFAATLTRNIHEFDTAANGSVNTQYVLSQAVGAGWKLSEKWSLSADLAYIMIESYQGVRKELYSHSQSVGFQQNELIAYSLSHSFGAPGISIYKPDGRTFEFELTDEDNSFVSGTVTLTF